MSMKTTTNDLLRLAAAVRHACMQAAREGYAEALLAGLCHEGAWENALSAMQRLDPAALLTSLAPPSDPGGSR
jgi:hypothetical protein